MNRQISQVAIASLDPARVADRRDDVLADVGLGGPLGAAGQRDPAGGAVHDRPRPDLRLERQDRARREHPQEDRRPDALLPPLPDATASPRRWSATRPRAARAPASSSAENSYLTASNADLGTILGTVGSRLKGTTIKGNSLVLTIHAGRAEARREPARREVRRGGRAQPEDRRRLRDGLDAGLQPEPGRAAGRVREDLRDQEPVPARAGGAAPEPRHPGPLPAGLDLQDDHGRGGARRRRLQARLDLRRPGLLHRVRQAGQERARPERPRGLRDREPRRGLPALDQRGVLQHRPEARREADPRGGAEVRLLLGAAARDAVGRALGLRPLPQRQALRSVDRQGGTRASTPAASPSGRTRC